MSDTMEFISLIRPKRPDFLSTMTPEEQATMARHTEYVRDMVAQGKVFLDGNSPDGTLGVLIYRVDSAIEARRLFYSDPAVIGGIGYPELYPLTIGHPSSS
nr:YciI family protein [uncultured Methanoregula sp.]